jgi:DNA-binding MurR/RpiR family transcriptional regulator
MTAATRDATHPIRVRDRIQARMPQMPAAMTKIAQLLLDSPTAPLHLSITELARQAGTSPATVTRFCRLIGYSGYVPFRVGVASDIGRGDALESWRADVGRVFGPQDAPHDVLRALLTAQTTSLQATADGVDVEQVGRVARSIATCAHLDIYGIGGSGGMAQEMAARLYRIGVNVHAWTEAHDGLTSAAIQRDGDVALAISNTGRTEETIEMLAQARSSGAFTVAVTSSATSPLATVADVHITAYATDGYLQPDDLAAKHAQLFILDLLYLLIAQQNFAQAATLLAASAMAVTGHRRALHSVPDHRADAGDVPGTGTDAGDPEDSTDAADTADGDDAETSSPSDPEDAHA